MLNDQNGGRRIGMNCPGCGNFMPMTLRDLFTSRPMRCATPDCGAVLRVNRAASRKSLRLLADYREDLRRFEAGGSDS